LTAGSLLQSFVFIFPSNSLNGRLFSERLSNKKIGGRLSITDGTIKVHLHKIFEKLRVSNRTALVAVYLFPR
jgi:hypothetical protein